MEFGICSTINDAPAVGQTGWNFLEGAVAELLQPAAEDARWSPPAAPDLPIRAANMLVPKTLPVVGPDVNRAALHTHMSRLLRRARAIGIETIVFGSGGARRVPADGFDRNRAVDQITDFLRLSAPLAAEHNVMLVVEPLNRRECNIINSIGEAMQYVRAVDHPNVRCLLDTYHFWLEREPLAHLEQALPDIRHVHVADEHGRLAPGLGGQPTSDYQTIFGILKQGGYAGRISVECTPFDIGQSGAQVLDHLRRAWDCA